MRATLIFVLIPTKTVGHWVSTAKMRLYLADFKIAKADIFVFVIFFHNLQSKN
jgi:hypothetical protein